MTNYPEHTQTPSEDNASSSEPPIYPITQPSYPPVPEHSSKKRRILDTFEIRLTLIVLSAIIVGSILVSEMNKSTTPNNTQSSTTSIDSSQNGQVDQSSDSSSSPLSSAPTDIPTPNGPAKVGDTITVNNVACTLVSVKIISGDEFDTPKAGDEFIVVHVKLLNHSNIDETYNEFDFHARSGSGNVTDPQAAPSTYTANNELDSGTLSPGGIVEGDIILEVPVGDHQAELSWKPNFDSSSTDNLWNLGL